MPKNTSARALIYLALIILPFFLVALFAINKDVRADENLNIKKIEFCEDLGTLINK